MGRALVVSAGSSANEYLARHLADLGHPRPVFAASGGEARRRMSEGSFDLVVVNAPLPDEFGHELATDAVRQTLAGVLLLAKAETAAEISVQLEDYGVLVLGRPFGGGQFNQAVRLCVACGRRLAGLEKENAKLQDKIAQIRQVDRAKCRLIEQNGMTEADAHRYIEKLAMDTRKSRGEIAREILERDSCAGL